jgi:hypothetical protein
MKNFKTIAIVLLLLSFIDSIQAQNEDEAVAKINEQVQYDEVVDRSTLEYDNTTQCQIRYYYYPNLEAYYDILKDIYHIKENGYWKIVEELPTNFRGYSVYNNASIKVTDYEDDSITEMLPTHKKKHGYITREKVRKQLIGAE